MSGKELLVRLLQPGNLWRKGRGQKDTVAFIKMTWKNASAAVPVRISARMLL
jgi:hypothetical protein